MAYEKELDAAKKAASLAARLCQKVQKALLQSDVQSKSDKSPVTVADYGSQAVVSIVLERELTSEPFSLVAEEDSADLRKDGSEDILERITKLVNDTLATEDLTKAIDSTLTTDDLLRAIDCGTSEGGPNGRHWVLDPIDGTKGFLRGDQYAVALGLLEEGKVVLGVLACPNLPLTSIAGNKNKNSSSSEETGCLFYATIGSGTYMQPLDSKSEPVKVHVSSVENPEEASFFESFEGAHSLHDLSSSIANKLGVKAPPVRIDSQAKYGALSRGDGAIYLRFPHKGYREKIWDHVAGAIVVTEAGGIVTDAGGKPPSIVQSNTIDDLLSRVNTATALLTYLKSKATTLVVADDFSQLSLADDNEQAGSISERDQTYVSEMLKHVETVTCVMDSLAKRAILAESEAAVQRGKALLSQQEAQRKACQINSMSSKLEDMEKFALGTTSILGEMRQRVDDLVEETSRQKARAAENEQELCRVRRDFESLKSYVSSLISVRETLVSSEKQFQTIERLFERLVAKTTQLESDKVQKEAEVQKLMEENVRLTALVDKKEAQLLAMNEQCKMMALSSI